MEMDSVCVMEVIVCTKTRRGNGIDDPIRIITEVFTKEGVLIAEYDPIAGRDLEAYRLELQKKHPKQN